MKSETQVTDLVPSLVNPTLHLKSANMVNPTPPLKSVKVVGPVPSSVSLIDHVVNLVMSLVELVDKVVDLIPSSVDLALLLESAMQVIDPFPPVNPILPLENENQVVDLMSLSIDPTLLLESKPDSTHIFLVDIESTVLGAIPPSPTKPHLCNEAILFDWGVLTKPCLPSHIPFNITVQVHGQDVPHVLIDDGLSVSFFSSIAWQYWGYPYLVPIT
jgi:hypothetical protein